MATNVHDWLSLVGISGLTVSEPVLMDVFPSGPPAFNQQLDRSFRREFARWRTAESDDNSHQRRWLNFVLMDMLGHDRRDIHVYPHIDETLIINLVDYEQTLAPNRVITAPDGTPRLLMWIAPPEQGLDKRETQTGRWRATPYTKIIRLLRETGVPLGLLTNGHTWRLVFAEANLPSAYIEWSAQGWADARLTAHAFKMLLGAERFDFDPPESDLIELIRASQSRQIEVADQLGDQVRGGLRAFARALDRSDEAADGDLLAHMSLGEIYEMCILVLMRLVFLLYAEERKLLPHGEVLYDKGYGLTYLWTRLQREQREAPVRMAQRFDAWPQLLATFRLVYGGVEHPDFTTPAYGGDLFDPARYPVLEDQRLRVSNRVVYMMLRRLLLAEGEFAGEKVLQRVSYRALDVEQLGYVYEGLLGYTLHRAEQTLVLGLGNDGEYRPYDDLLDAEVTYKKLYEFFKDISGRSVHWSASKSAAEAGPNANADDPYGHLQPYGEVIDLDELVYEGDLIVTEDPTERRATGTHYTPITLTEPIVRHTLEPQVYDGPAEGWDEWRLKPAADLLSLTVCDMAMGSGAFLVQACRYLSERLVEAWEIAESSLPRGASLTPMGERATGQPGEQIVPTEPDDRAVMARRLIADRCLYGVDKNPLAVDIAKLSMWLITLDRQRPFTFLDHALKAGDSLVGVSVEQLRLWNLDTRTQTIQLETGRIRRQIEQVTALRRELSRFPVETTADQQRKRDLLTEAEAIAHDLRSAADLLVASYMTDLPASDQRALRARLLQTVQEGTDVRPTDADLTHLGDLDPFHWQLEFPEVFSEDDGGFSAFVGNPPFIGGKKITTEYGSAYREFLIEAIAEGERGSADIVAYFFRQAFDMLREGGSLGLIATNTIAQGDTREISLQPIAARGGTIYRAERNRPWPGVAAVNINTANIFKGEYESEYILDDEPVPIINDMLDDLPDLGEPEQLAANDDLSFVGTFVLGMGFVMEPEEAHALIDKDPRNEDVLFPYLNGADLNQRPDQSPSRWVINFFDWDLEQAEQYPDVMQIIKRDVKPERQRKKKNGEYALRNPLPHKWWIYADKRPALYETIAPLDRVLVVAQTSRTLAFSFVPNGWVYSMMTIVFAFQKSSALSLLQSTIHDNWVRRYASTMKLDIRYTPSDVFQTFPFPEDMGGLEAIGEEYHAARQAIMLEQWEGLTDTYNRFHNPDEHADDIAHLRALHVQMDEAVAAAYGWDDLALGHGFRETMQGVRYTISDAARREVLTRLLLLNHERYAAEVEAGLHGERAKKELAKKKAADDQMTMF